MKLHLPKLLLTALLATFVASPLVWAEEQDGADLVNESVSQTFSGDVNNKIVVTGYDGNDTITFALTSTSQNSNQNWFGTGNADQETAASIVIGDGVAANADTVGLIINNGNGDTTNYQDTLFTGSVTGSGIIKRIGAGDGTSFIFAGDMTGYTGNIYLGTGANVDFNLVFGGKTDAVKASATTATKGIAGTGTITIANASDKVIFNYSASENPVYITNAISESGNVTGSTLILKGGASYKFTKDVNVDNLTLEGGSALTINSLVGTNGGMVNVTGGEVILAGQANAIGSAGLTISNATVSASASFDSNQSIIHNDATVNINAGGKLELKGHDVVGWNSGQSAAEFILAGESKDKLAKLDIVETKTGAATTTLGTLITMKGHTLFSGTKLNTWGAAFTVEGTNNTVDVDELLLRKELKIEIKSGGELTLAGSLGEHSEADSGTNNGSITKTGVGLLNLTASLSENFALPITIAEGGLSSDYFGVVLTEGTNEAKAARKNLIFDTAEADAVIKTTGTGYILLKTDEYTLLADGGLVLQKNYKVDGDFSINGEGYKHQGEKRTFSVGSGKSFTTTGALSVVSRAELLISGGSVTAGSINLGHTVGGAYQGYLAMSFGSLTSGTITLNNTHSNSIDITGGTVEFTTATALSRGQNTASTINITGTSADAPVVLKATKAAWTLDGSGLTAAPTMGNIKVDAGNTHAITLKNVALSGSVVNNATLKLDGSRGVNIASLGGTGDMEITGSDTDEFNIESVDSGMLTITGSAKVNLTGRGTDNELDCLRSEGGELTITTQNLAINGDGKFSSTHQDGLYIKNSTVNVGDGTQTVLVTVNRVEMGDAKDEQPAGSTYIDDSLNIAKNATLVVTGDDVTSGSDQYHRTGFLLGEWGKTSTLNIEGAVYAKDASIMVGDYKAVINVEDGAVLATKGLRAQADKNDSNPRHITLNVKDGAKLILGETGIASTHKDYTVTFGKAEIGMTAETSITENITLNNAAGTTFNTALYTWNEAGDAVTAGTTGGDMVVSGNLGGTGKLVKTGAGTLELRGTNTYSGGTEVQDGTLVATKGTALGNGNVVVKGGAVEITDGTGKITVEKRKADTDATITKNGGYAFYVGEPGKPNDAINITHARVTVESENDLTINHKIGHDGASVLVNNGSGLLTTTNGYNNYSALEALVGDINVQWSTWQGNLDYLLLKDDRTIAVHSQDHGLNELTQLASITVTETATFGNNAKLHANLVLQSGATVSLGSDVVVEGTLTLGNEMTLTGAQLEEIQALKEHVELFHNVDQLKLMDALARSGAAVDYTQAQDLSQFFSNVDSGVYLLEFDRGVVYATLIPEPATGTLSLLALAALAARRRRRH